MKARYNKALNTVPFKVNGGPYYGESMFFDKLLSRGHKCYLTAVEDVKETSECL